MTEKSAWDMTEQEAKKYHEEVMAQDKWVEEDIKFYLTEGYTYRQIAFQLQTT